jgi:hypothetical protein
MRRLDCVQLQAAWCGFLDSTASIRQTVFSPCFSRNSLVEIDTAST